MMLLLQDSLGRCEIVGDDEFVRVTHARKGTKVAVKIDREEDDFGNFWIAFVSLVGGKPGDYITFGSRFQEDLQPLVEGFAKQHGFFITETTFTSAARGQKAKAIETTS